MTGIDQEQGIWDEINTLASEISGSNQKNDVYKLREKLLHFFQNWGNQEVLKYNAHTDCLKKKYRGNYIAKEVLYKTIAETTSRYEYEKNNNFMAYFFSRLEVKNRYFWSDLRRKSLDMIIPKADEGDDDDGDIISEIPDGRAGPDDFVLESHIVLQAMVLLRPITDYSASFGLKVTDAQKNYFRYFFTQDAVSIIKSIVSDEEIKKIAQGEKPLFRAIVEAFVYYLYQKNCATVDDLHINEFRDVVEYKNTKNGVEGIFVETQEISKDLVVEEKIDQYESIEALIEDIKNGKYAKKIENINSNLSHMRKKYDKFMRVFFRKHGSHIFD